ncbi:MAG: glycoside hydrolase family 9 protein [Acidobacteriota bacterium]
MPTRALIALSLAVSAFAAEKNSAEARWLNKKVLESRLLDDMERLDRWSVVSTGPEGVVDARVTAKAAESYQGIARMELTAERARDGGHSLRLSTPTRLPGLPSTSGRGWGRSIVTRRFDGEDWSRFNRISFWVWPDGPGRYTVTLDLRFHNEGAVKVPPPFTQEGEHTIVLRNHEWNHIVWEIGNLARDRVTALDFICLLDGNEPEASNRISFDFDRLELERVDPDYIEGWGVWPGRISYSQAGYAPGGAKTAIASGLTAKEFQLLDARGQAALRKPIRTVATRLGKFQVMDFSEVRRPGTYTLAAGAARTHPFRIGPDVWRESILKALNFFHSERCGYAIPGVHGVCHRDWQCVHGDQRIIINGGWHDAGDLTQGLGNTAEAAYGMFRLAEALEARKDDPELQARLVDEARWGLDWILKTSFRDGYRNAGSINSRRTDGILGNDDDIVVKARKQPLESFVAAAAEAIGARVLKQSDPRIAAYSLKMAQEDWEFGAAALAAVAPPGKDLFSGSFDSAGVVHEPVSAGVLAAVEIWRATGDRRYADKAAEMARVLLDSQERGKPDWDTPLTGFFYTGPDRRRILHYCHRGREQGPVLALTALAEAFPDHPDWMKWYSAVALHAEYLKATAKYTEPYGVLPASVYNDREYEAVPETRRESFRRQVLNGVPLGAGHYLRLFPVWMDYRGHFGTILPKAQALTAAARLRGDAASAELAALQAEWVLGRNPFAQSTMYGVGYDYATLYSPMSGDIDGALPVGIQTRGDADAPYWPVQSTWTYKEVWVHPVARWIWLMADLYGNPMLKSAAAFSVTHTQTAAGEVTIRARGARRYSVRAENLALEPAAEGAAEWRGRVVDRNTPWFAVVIPDGDRARRQEVTGPAF